MIYWRTDVYIINMFWFLYLIKQIDFKLPCVCSVIDHRRRQNVVRTSVTHSVIASCATFLFLLHRSITEQTHSNMESIY